MRLPYPLDECECGHYRISHNSKTRVSETTCNASKCARFSLKKIDDQRREVEEPSLMEEPEMTVGAKHVQLKSPDIDQIKQVIHIGGPPSRLIQCAAMRQSSLARQITSGVRLGTAVGLVQ